ncbi:hypothetical protein [Bradyrhizobium sp. RDM4]|uniref:hypothetical protein n=1 Tax=Bradyrhizobium sp. RDM4 TaxID=3378765 RepID=UPI0038FD10DF
MDDSDPEPPVDDLRQARELALLFCKSEEAIETFIAHCYVAARDLLMRRGDVVIVLPDHLGCGGGQGVADRTRAVGSGERLRTPLNPNGKTAKINNPIIDASATSYSCLGLTKFGLLLATNRIGSTVSR